jgi:probable HAF family extracellular repeat protein
MRVFAAPATFVIAALGGIGSANAAPLYIVEDLGVLNGDNVSNALAVNEAGQVTGTSRLDNGFLRAVLWSSTTPTDLETAIGEPTSTANGLNNAGHLTTVAGFPTPGVSTGGTAHFWDGTTLTDIGKLGTGTPQSTLSSVGNAINDNDQVVGRAWASDMNTGNFHAFSWQAGVIRDLGTFGACTDSEAWDVNNNGQIVGHASGGGSCLPTQALIWSSALATPVSINGILAGAGITDNIVLATGINEAGLVAAQRVAGGRGRCVIFNPGPSPTVVDIGYIGVNGAAQTCVPGDINSQGEVVGYQAATPDRIPLLYSGGTLYDINTLLDAGSAADWLLLTATDINDSGTIVGQGRIGGELHAFRATLAPVPAPGAALLFGTAILGLAVRAKRRLAAR